MTRQRPAFRYNDVVILSTAGIALGVVWPTLTPIVAGVVPVVGPWCWWVLLLCPVMLYAALRRVPTPYTDHRRWSRPLLISLLVAGGAVAVGLAVWWRFTVLMTY